MMDLSNELGSAALNRGDYKEARKQFRFMVKESLKHELKDQAIAQNRLGTACVRDKRYKEAEEAYRASVDLAERAYGATHFAVSIELNNLGFVLWKGLGDKAGAKQQFEKAVELIENAIAAGTEEISAFDREIFSEAFENLASVYEGERNLSMSEELLRKAIKVQTDGSIATSQAQLRPLMSLVQLLDKQGRKDEARELMDQHLAGAKQALGVDAGQ